jgi:uncharacterized membrane-anchored protein
MPLFRNVVPTLIVLALPLAAAAQTPSGSDQRAAEAQAAAKNAMATAIHGPTNVALHDEAHLHLNPDDAWIPPVPARRLLRAWGNTPGPETLGMVVGGAPGHHWTAIVTYTEDGFVKDNDARDLNPADILAQLRDATDHDNEDRRARGFPALELSGWLQPPAYDAATHRLVWALRLHNAGSSDNDSEVNYNTRTLGRQGYISVNLLTDATNFAQEKPKADALLGGLTYDQGKRYQDFDASTDHVAEYGLAALIGVVAVKKLGLIALATAFVLKFAKLGAVAVVGLGAALRRLLRRRPAPPANTV